MNDKRATLEVIAPTVEEAVEKGLGELGLTRKDVEYEVLDEGSKGLLGFGNRQARVRLTVSASAGESASSSSAPPEIQIEERSIPISELDPEIENVLGVAEATVAELLDKMDIPNAKLHTRVTASDDHGGIPTVVVDIRGDDLSILIGRRSETLNALQYITRLIAGKEVGHGVNILVDVEGYRTRRERSLRQLARKMAAQSVKTGRQMVLEPMPASERRIVHIELRDDDQVSTESVGEEPRRKVTINPN